MGLGTLLSAWGLSQFLLLFFDDVDYLLQPFLGGFVKCCILHCPGRLFGPAFYVPRGASKKGCHSAAFLAGARKVSYFTLSRAPFWTRILRAPFWTRML